MEWFDIQGFMEGSPQSLDKYSLVYYFNNQQIDDFYKARYSFFINLRNLQNDLEFGNKSDRIEIYRGNHCNIYIPNVDHGVI